LIEQPVRARHLVAARVPASPPPAATSAEPVGRLAGLQLLAAEDNEVNALVLEAIVRMEGASLHLVENGRLAVQALQAHAPGHFHLVLTDIQMPEMDGYTATREMLALDPTLPIVGLTAHAMAEERERCLKAGMVDHLAKPIEVEPLIAAILRHARKA
jgi:CheY-like chemotaxis protein